MYNNGVPNNTPNNNVDNSQLQPGPLHPQYKQHIHNSDNMNQGMVDNNSSVPSDPNLQPGPLHPQYKQQNNNYKPGPANSGFNTNNTNLQPGPLHQSYSQNNMNNNYQTNHFNNGQVMGQQTMGGYPQNNNIQPNNGMPNIMQQQAKPFLDDDQLLYDFVRRNQTSILYKRFNWCAFFFSYYYYFYRKFFLLGAISLGLALGLPYVFNMLMGNSLYGFVISGIVSIVLAFLFNDLYVKNAKKTIQTLKIQTGSNQFALRDLISKKGGTSGAYVIVTMIAYSLLFNVLGLNNFSTNSNFFNNGNNTIIITDTDDSFFKHEEKLIDEEPGALDYVFNENKTPIDISNEYNIPRDNGARYFDSNISITSLVELKAPKGFTVNESLVNGYSFERRTNADTCKISLYALENKPSAYRYAVGLAKLYGVTLYKVTYNMDMYTISYNISDDTVEYIAEHGGRVYTLEFTDNHNSCARFREEVLKSFRFK